MPDKSKEQLLHNLKNNILSSLSQLVKMLSPEQQRDLNKVMDDVSKLQIETKRLTATSKLKPDGTEN